jgi:hypothetical protein
VIVDAPWTGLPADRSATAARAMLATSRPSFFQKVRSSAATVALRIHGDIARYATGSRWVGAGIEPRR